MSAAHAGAAAAAINAIKVSGSGRGVLTMRHFVLAAVLLGAALAPAVAQTDTTTT